MEETKELSLNEKVNKLLENIPKTEEEKETKGWKLPFLKNFNFRVGKKKVEKGYAQVIIIRNNRHLEFVKAQVKDGIAVIDGFPRVFTANHTLFYNKKPTYIIPEWNLIPFSPEDNLAESEKQKTSLAGRRAVLATLETEKIKSKKDLGSLIWIVVIVIVCGAAYYFGKQSGWF